MEKYKEIKYTRPRYKTQIKNLEKYREQLSIASSYEEARSLWLSMKKSMQYIDFLEQYAYTNFLCGYSFDFYSNEVNIQNMEYPKLVSLQKECDKIILNSPYVNDFSSEFGNKIIELLKNSILLSDELIIPLQSLENKLKSEYIVLLSEGKYKSKNEDIYYNILDNLIKIRTETALALGFNNYIEMAYKIHGRCDYGVNDIVSFRSQIQRLISPACTELRKTQSINYPKANISNGKEIISFIKYMFSDISSDSAEYINYMIDHEMFDINDRAHKRSDIFSCCMQPFIKKPFIIGCFHGNGLEVNSLIHEFGHGYAFYSAANSQTLWEYHRSVTSINEVHSKSMEHFAYPYLDKLFGNCKREYVFNHLFHSFDNLPYRCAIDEFEHELYNNLNLSRIQRCELWAEIEKKYMPWKVCNIDAIKQGTYWPNQTHLFTHPFYYIEYNIAQISVCEFYQRSKENYKKSWRDYSNLCHAGGSRNYLDLLKIGNLSNPFLDGTVKKICEPIINELFSLK